MIKLFAVVFLMVNGQPTEQVGRMENKTTFDTMAQCEAYKATPKFELENLMLNAMLKAEAEALMAKEFVCEAGA